MPVLKLATNSALHDVPFTCTTFAARRDQGNNLEGKAIISQSKPPSESFPARHRLEASGLYKGLTALYRLY